MSGSHRGAYVYLIADAKSGLHKIGRSIDPQGRLIELGGKVEPLALVHTIAVATEGDSRLLERYLHVAFGADRVRGEWFRLSADDVALLKAVPFVRDQADLPASVRDRHAVRSEIVTPRRTVQIPEDWLRVAQELAAARPLPVMWLLVELLRQEAEAKGKADLPPTPWAIQPKA